MGLILLQPELSLAILSLSAPLVVPIQAAESVPGLVVPAGWKLEKNGDDLLLQPDDLPDGALFRVIIKPLKPLSDSTLRAWFKTRLEEDAGTQGKLLKDGPIQVPKGTEMLMSARGFQTTSGDQRAVGYLAFAAPGEQARLVLIATSPNKEVYELYMATALKTVIGMASGAGTLKPAASRSSTSREDSPRPERKPATAYATAPGAGLKPSQILGVYMVLTYRAGVGGAIYPEYDPVLFLKDGTYCENTAVPPADLDVEASRRGEPRKWGHWKRVGDKFQLQDEKGKWGDPKKLVEAKPGGKGERLNGTFTSIGGGGNTALGGGTIIAVSNSFTFSPNGSFNGGKSVGASSAEPTSDVSVTTSSKQASAGTYTIDGYTLTLRYSNGRIERRFFAYMDAKDKDAIYINGNAFLLKK